MFLYALYDFISSSVNPADKSTFFVLDALYDDERLLIRHAKHKPLVSGLVLQFVMMANHDKMFLLTFLRS